MSDEAQAVESKSKIEMTRNSKGDCQWRIVAVEGVHPEELDHLRGEAVRQYHALESEMLGLTH